jgi:hypothetical protein
MNVFIFFKELERERVSKKKNMNVNEFFFYSLNFYVNVPNTDIY